MAVDAWVKRLLLQRNTHSLLNYTTHLNRPLNEKWAARLRLATVYICSSARQLIIEQSLSPRAAFSL